MAYCDQDDILKLIPEQDLAELTTESGETPDDEVVADCIAAADGEIDSYLGVKYSVPLATVPDRVKWLSADMAIYHLYSRRGVAPEVRRQKYLDAVTFLKDVVAGTAKIVGLAGEAAATTPDVHEMTSSTRVFSRDNMGDW